jgi:hypothetical protein
MIFTLSPEETGARISGSVGESGIAFEGYSRCKVTLVRSSAFVFSSEFTEKFSVFFWAWIGMLFEIFRGERHCRFGFVSPILGSWKTFI